MSNEKERTIEIEHARALKELEREFPESPPIQINPIIPKTLYICPKCKLEVDQLTRDHIIPKWFYNPSRLRDLGLRDKGESWGKISMNNRRYICLPCNLKKGGVIDYTDPIVRQFVRNIIKRFQANLDAVKTVSVKVQVVCKCHETS